MVWQFIAAVAVSLVASFVLRPRPQSQPPATLEDITVPTAEDGREQPVLFGCWNMKSMNVTWYGDLRTTPIKVKGGKK
ncbi:MAG: hypothetical protein AAF662_08305 [Pseudomonadota bacterium]